MAEILGKIVLTGGPCAGKTTALAKIEEELTEKGYRVFIVSESATELIKGGIKPFGQNPFDLLKFQELILQYQMIKERIYEEAVKSLPIDDKCIIVYDRGVLDNKAYITKKQFTEILNKFNLNEFELLDNYDMVIHLVTAADGKENYYTLSNNTARSETVDEARKLDKKTANAWVGHNNLKIIDNSTEFDVKLGRVMTCIYNLLGNPIPIKQQRKFEVDLSKINLESIIEESCNQVYIEQTYLKNSLQTDQYERRLRKKIYDNQILYYYTVQSSPENGLSKIVTDKKITEKDYYKILAMYDEQYVVRKTRYSFVRNKQYFKLDIFDDNNLAILEIEPTNENQVIDIPLEIPVIKEVTDNPNYLNHSIANKKECPKQKEVSYAKNSKCHN